jgi:hypothetical protein
MPAARNGDSAASIEGSLQRGHDVVSRLDEPHVLWLRGESLVESLIDDGGIPRVLGTDRVRWLIRHLRRR